MGRGKRCTDYQRHMKKRMAAAGIKRKTIELVMERTRTFVANALRTSEMCLDSQNALRQPKRAWTTEMRKSTLRPQKTTAKEDRKIVNRSKKH